MVNQPYYFTIYFIICKAKKHDMSDKVNIVTTIFPIYDMTKEIINGNDNIKISFLMNNGIDPHNYKPNAKDIVSIKNSDLFIFVGGESDSYVYDLIDSNIELSGKCLNLMDNMKELEILEKLVELGADVNKVSNGQTALMHVSFNKKMMDKLKSLGADTTIKDEFGLTADENYIQMLEIENGKLVIVKIEQVLMFISIQNYHHLMQP